MAARLRSETSTSLQRPDSRASTMSATSQHHDNSANMVQLGAKQYPASMPSEPEASLLRYSVGLSHQHMPQYDMSQHQNMMANHHAHGMQMPAQGAYMSHDQQYWPQELAQHDHSRLESVPFQVGPEVMDDKRKKGSAVTATNDRELREMLAKNEGRQLSDVAQEVIQKERTPMAEKTKQLFAMLWLRSVCKPAKTSVPRNRVYSQYANRCGTERVVPLNPASFGKLVRVIFPGIQTRRLGVRGESKYHYVDLALDEGHPAMQAMWASQAMQPAEPRQGQQSAGAQHIDFNTMPHTQADTAAFPTPDAGFDFAPVPETITPRGPASRSQTFAYPDTRGMQPGTVETLTYAQKLRFPASNVPAFAENEPVNLPSIQPYLPPRTDQDTSEALFALYRTHCTSLIDSIRFCKEKQFFRLYTSFQGTLTVPVQKLFTHPNLAPWIEQCDLIMYRTMVRFVSRLTLQAAPVVVINILSNISANLHSHISKTFSVQPAHVLEAKLRPATVFASLLHRLIRVNQSAHAAANLLTIDQNREMMWREYVMMVNPKRVMEAELPNCGYEEVYKILTTEIRGLMEPLQAPDFHNDPYAFGPYSFEENGSFSQFVADSNMQSAPRTGASTVTTENVLDRWSAFITSLPGRFPNAPAQTLLHCISAVGTAALRDLTIMNGQSWGHWWVLKLFVDEMALWMAEMGGFLEPSQATGPADSNSHPFQSPLLENSDGNGGSRMSSMGADAASHSAGTSSHQSYQGQGPQQLSYTAHHNHSADGGKTQQAHDTDIDDSGIGMSLMDDDMSLHKYGLTPHMAGDSMVGAHLMRV